MLVTPERWYVVFWTFAGACALAPIYVLLYRIWRVAETIQFILSVKR